MSINDIAYDKDDIMKALQEIKTVISEEHEVLFNYYANEIECATDYLIERLKHSEVERFSK